MNSKNKGKSLENQVAAILRNFFGSDDRHIKRNVSSGTQKGEESDINILDSNIESKFPFLIEVKNQEKWKFSDLLGDNVNRKSNPFVLFWKQIEDHEIKTFEKRYNVNKPGLLVFSKAFYPIYTMIKFNDIRQYDYTKLSYLDTTINGTRYLVFEFNSFLTLFGDKHENK